MSWGRGSSRGSRSELWLWTYQQAEVLRKKHTHPSTHPHIHTHPYIYTYRKDGIKTTGINRRRRAEKQGGKQLDHTNLRWLDWCKSFWIFTVKLLNSPLSVQHNLPFPAGPSCFPCFWEAQFFRLSWGPVRPNYYGWRFGFLISMCIKALSQPSHCSQVCVPETCKGQLPRD